MSVEEAMKWQMKFLPMEAEREAKYPSVSGSTAARARSFI